MNIDISHLCKEGTNLIDFERLLGHNIKEGFSSFTFPWPTSIHDLSEDIAWIKLSDDYSIDIGCYHVFSEVIISLVYSGNNNLILYRRYIDITRYDKILDAIQNCDDLYRYSSPRYLKWLILKAKFKKWLKYKKYFWDNIIWGNGSVTDIYNENLREKINKEPNNSILEAHEFCNYNKEFISQSKKCGCFYCFKIFTSNEVIKYIDKTTALCPFCHVDSVIPDNCGYDITLDFLEKMHKYWFNIED